LLGERLDHVVTTTGGTSSVCMPADETVGSGDRYLVGELGKARGTRRSRCNKTDLSTRIGWRASASIAAPARGHITGPTSCRCRR
jgi:hypothetical protein